MKTGQIFRREFFMAAPAKKDAKKGTYFFQASTEAINSHELIIRQDGIKLDRYAKNPVVLRDHKRSSLVGTADEFGFNATGLYIQAKFSKATQEARDTEGLVADGTLRGCSIAGWIRKVFWSYNSRDDKPDLYDRLTQDEKEKLLSRELWGVVFEMDIFEISVCAVPSDDDCLSDLSEDEELCFSLFGNQETVVPATATRKETQMNNVTPREPATVPDAPDVAALNARIQALESQNSQLAQDRKQLELDSAERRKREDKQDFRVLLAEGFTTPAHEEQEIKFLSTLSISQKEYYFDLVRSKAKCWNPGKTAPVPTAADVKTFDAPGTELSADEIEWRQALGLGGK